MDFRVWLEEDEKRAKVIAHIAGPPACGKTTLVDMINRNHKHVIAKDLDDFDTAGKAIMGWHDKGVGYTDEKLADLHKIRLDLYHDFLRKSEKPVVLAGIHVEGETRYPIPKHARKFILDVDPQVVGARQYERGKNGEKEYSGNKADIPRMAKGADQEVLDLVKSGYDRRRPNEILGWIKSQRGH